MNTSAIYALKIAKTIYRKGFSGSGGSFFDYSSGVIKGQQASDHIRQLLLQDAPVMIARFGSVELNCLTNYISINHHKNNYAGYIKGNVNHFWWDKNTITNMSGNAGFFPSNPASLSRFSKMMLEDIDMLDVLGSWQHQELMLQHKLQGVIKVGLLDLEPYNHDEPWSAALEGKKVLVVHPFDQSIREQYKKREQLFPDKNVLPDFELKTFRAVQSIANNSTRFKDWFEALAYMKEKIAEIDFDIAIIGCGAYGFPLAAHIKRLGKKALHLGGATQVLFGIKGKRWETQKEHYRVAAMMNEHWVRPLSAETPERNKTIEDGCYW